MNKKLNTALFIIGATLVNIIIMGALFFAGFFIASRLLPQDDVSPNFLLIVFMLIFIGSILGSFFLYHRLIRFISSKVDMDKYFHPIFRQKKKKQ